VAGTTESADGDTDYVILKVSDADGNLLAFCDEKAFHPRTAGMDVVADSKGRILLLDPMENQVRIYELVPGGKAERR